MPRFYFNLRNDIIADDEEGMELPDLKAAREHAIFSARSVAAENVRTGRLDLSHRIEIVNHSGQVVDIVTFADAVTVDRTSAPLYQVS